MLAQPAMLSGAVPDRSPLGWLILLPLGCLVLGQLLLVTTGIIPVLDGLLVDPDGYMRLNRVLALHDGGAWFDSRYGRINPPEGHVQHWTRPLDALLLAGAWLLEPLLGFARALHLWGVLISPALLALAVLATAWAAAPALDRDSRLLACLVLLVQPIVLAYTSVGRPDHHSLLLLLALLLIGLSARLAAAPQDRRAAVLAGTVAAIAVWVSPEALTFVAVSLAALGLFWLAGVPGLGRANRAYLLATTATLAIALLIERGPGDLLAIESDRLSIVHLVLFALIAGFWSVMSLAEPADVSSADGPATGGHPGPLLRLPLTAGAGVAPVVGRALAALAGVVALAAIMALAFPDLRQGPLGQVDPLYDRIRLQNIIEIQPLLRTDWIASGRIGEALERLIKGVGIALIALPCLGILLARTSGPARRFWATVALALLVFLPLAFHQVRWASYAEAFLVWPYAAGIAWLLGRLSGASGSAGVVLRPLVIVAALFWPLVLAATLPQQIVGSAGRSCPLDRLVAVLDRAAPGPQTLLAYADYGSELLYRTPHRVLAIPNHRPQPGFAATYRILTATDEEVARAELARFGVDWILLCPSATERWLFAVPGASGTTFYERLADGEPPRWLRPLPLEDDLAEAARLFEVTLGNPSSRAVAAHGSR